MHGAGEREVMTYRSGMIRYPISEIVKVVREVLFALNHQLHDELDLSVVQGRQDGSALSAADEETRYDFIGERFPAMAESLVSTRPASRLLS
jgi:hypothetical protein